MAKIKVIKKDGDEKKSIESDLRLPLPKKEAIKPDLRLPSLKKEQSNSKFNVFGGRVGRNFLLGGEANFKIGDKSNVSIGHNELIGENSERNESINISKSNRKGGNFSIGYDSNKEVNASYTSPKGSSFSARYSPIRGATVSARINLGKRKNK